MNRNSSRKDDSQQNLFFASTRWGKTLVIENRAFESEGLVESRVCSFGRQSAQ
jgi:hypothetical protein